MCKAVMISIRPKWCEKIIRGEKTIEVRKNRPNKGTPFKCYIYCSKSGDARRLVGERGKVIGEFTCERIYEIGKRGIPENFDYCYLSLNEWGNDDIETEIKAISASCVSKEKINAYGAKAPFLYGWHISDLKIYDTPKDVSKFSRPFENCIDKVCDEFGCESCENGGHIKRPPQSWCYVEEM